MQTKTQEFLKRKFAAQASCHFSALAIEKESYNTIKKELEKERDELINELNEKQNDKDVNMTIKLLNNGRCP